MKITWYASSKYKIDKPTNYKPYILRPVYWVDDEIEKLEWEDRVRKYFVSFFSLFFCVEQRGYDCITLFGNALFECVTIYINKTHTYTFKL